MKVIITLPFICFGCAFSLHQWENMCASCKVITICSFVLCTDYLFCSPCTRSQTRKCVICHHFNRITIFVSHFSRNSHVNFEMKLPNDGIQLLWIGSSTSDFVIRKLNLLSKSLPGLTCLQYGQAVSAFSVIFLIKMDSFEFHDLHLFPEKLDLTKTHIDLS